MEEYFSKIIQAIGEDVNREGLRDTPKRAAEAFKFLNNGYEKNLEQVLNDAIFGGVHGNGSYGVTVNASP